MHEFYDRFKNILSDPINCKINRVVDAGQVKNGLVTMCTGLKIKTNSYYGSFSDIFIINKGVHEPSEEFIFYDIIQKIKNKNSVMIELGSYWSYYSMCFLQQNPNGKCFLVESDINCLKIGIEHFNINNLNNGIFVHGFVSDTGIKMDNFVMEYSIPKIDILLADIQGYELEMLQGSRNILKNKLVDYIFLSTHSQELHTQCVNFLIENNYKILASSDFENQTFCYDGIIVSCSTDIDSTPYSLYNRSESEIVSDSFIDNLLKI